MTLRGHLCNLYLGDWGGQNLCNFYLGDWKYRCVFHLYLGDWEQDIGFTWMYIVLSLFQVGKPSRSVVKVGETPHCECV